MFPLKSTISEHRESINLAQAMASVVLMAMMACSGLLLLAKCLACISALNRLTPWELARVMSGM